MATYYAIESLAMTFPSLTVSQGNDRGPYINLDFESDDPKADWMKIQAWLEDVKGLRISCIVTCQGRHGWDDYLLLHHFDPDEPCDDLPEEF